MSCERCDFANIKGVLHHYEWIPPEKTDSPTLFFNVPEIRLAMHTLGIRELGKDPYPYDEKLIGLVNSHEIIHEHIPHIPDDKIRPSLVGNIKLPRKVTGQMDIYSLMLDGHHSALKCMQEKRPVIFEVIADWLLESMVYPNVEAMTKGPLVVLEGPMLVWEGSR